RRHGVSVMPARDRQNSSAPLGSTSAGGVISTQHAPAAHRSRRRRRIHTCTSAALASPDTPSTTNSGPCIARSSPSHAHARRIRPGSLVTLIHHGGSLARPLAGTPGTLESLGGCDGTRGA